MTANDGLDRAAGDHAERRFGRRVIVHDALPSTQDVAKEIAAGQGRAADGVVVTTHRQTGGRGTRGRRWWSPTGASLAASVIVVCEPPLARPACVTQLAALAVVRAAANAALVVRWPNDVVDARGAKVAGILAELVPSASGLAHVIGVGVNVFEPQEAAPQPLPAGFGTIQGAGGACADLGAFLMDYLRGLEAEWQALEHEGIPGLARRLNAHDGLAGHRVEFARGAQRRAGIFAGVDADLAPRLEQADRTVLTWPAEHVEVISIDGVARAHRETNDADS